MKFKFHRFLSCGIKPVSRVLFPIFTKISINMIAAIYLGGMLPYRSCHPEEYAGQTQNLRWVLLRIGFTAMLSYQSTG